MNEKNLIHWVEEQENACKDFGFYWENIEQLIDQIQGECKEVHEAWDNKDRTHLQEEVGDLLQAAISLAVFCQLDASETLHKSCEKFQKRFDAVVDYAKRDGFQTLHNQSFEVLMHYWNLAKKKC